MARFKTAPLFHPKDLEHGDRVTIVDGNGNELTGLVRRTVADNQLEISLTLQAFGKEIRIATFKAGAGFQANGRWTPHYPVTHKEAALW